MKIRYGGLQIRDSITLDYKSSMTKIVNNGKITSVFALTP